MEKLLDLYLTEDFPKEALTERKSRLETTIAALSEEKADLTIHVMRFLSIPLLNLGDNVV